MHSTKITYLNKTLFRWDQLLKERICSSGSKFFLLREDPWLDGSNRLEKHQESKKYGGNHDRKHDCASMHLN